MYNIRVDVGCDLLRETIQLPDHAQVRAGHGQGCPLPAQQWRAAQGHQAGQLPCHLAFLQSSSHLQDCWLWHISVNPPFFFFFLGICISWSFLNTPFFFLLLYWWAQIDNESIWGVQPHSSAGHSHLHGTRDLGTQELFGEGRRVQLWCDAVGDVHSAWAIHWVQAPMGFVLPLSFNDWLDD